jgi:hypothetical protein
MANAFDPYRDALVVETSTLWPETYEGWEEADRARVEQLLHDEPQHAAELDYLRMHTGFCRQITVTDEDIERVDGRR